MILQIVTDFALAVPSECDDPSLASTRERNPIKKYLLDLLINRTQVFSNNNYNTMMVSKSFSTTSKFLRI